jgi:NADH-quinone oxidoreductase subunit J
MSLAQEFTGQVLASQVLAAGGEMSTGEKIVFWILGPIALAGAIGMVLAKNAVHSALFLVMTMFSLGVFYVLQGGPFIGMVQIIVYTGAIMILFLFVLMLVGRDSSDSVVETLRGQRFGAIVLGIGFAGLVAGVIVRALGKVKSAGLDEANAAGNVPAIAAKLFSDYVLAFEVASALLITAAVGAMVLAHVEKDPGAKRSQRERSRARFRDGGYPAPKPGPGVYATANSVTTPALLPDGTTSAASVPGSVGRLLVGSSSEPSAGSLPSPERPSSEPPSPEPASPESLAGAIPSPEPVGSEPVNPEPPAGPDSAPAGSGSPAGPDPRSDG